MSIRSENWCIHIFLVLKDFRKSLRMKWVILVFILGFEMFPQFKKDLRTKFVSHLQWGILNQPRVKKSESFHSHFDCMESVWMKSEEFYIDKESARSENCRIPIFLVGNILKATRDLGMDYKILFGWNGETFILKKGQRDLRIEAFPFLWVGRY